MEASDGQLPGNAVLLDAAKHLETAIRKLGIVCGGCGDPLEPAKGELPAGWEYISLVPTMRDDKATVAAKSMTLCARACCAERRRKLNAEATARRRVVIPWELLSGDEASDRADYELGVERDYTGTGAGTE